MKTFADVLRETFDIKFPKDTVVIDATSVAKGTDDGTIYDSYGFSSRNMSLIYDPLYRKEELIASGFPCLPIFNNMIIYSKHESNLFGVMYTGYICSFDNDVFEAMEVNYQPPYISPIDSMLLNARYFNAKHVFRAQFYKYKLVSIEWVEHTKAGHLINTVIKQLSSHSFTEEGTGSLCDDLPLWAMLHLHQKHEVELVTPSRQYRRQMKRKTGKTPSPYFMLKVGKAPKEYASTGNGTGGSGHKNKMHVVRGHFRTNTDHPLPQFNRTMWIPAHMRGDESRGRVNKGYTIETD